MGTTCAGCGRRVTAAGGMPNLWTFGDEGRGTGITLELEDGTEHLLCYPCLTVLPEEPTAIHVDRLERVDGETSRLAPP